MSEALFGLVVVSSVKSGAESQEATMRPNQQEKEAFAQLEELEQKIFTIQRNRYGILFARDHQSQSQEDFAYYDEEATRLEKEALSLGETYASQLRSLRKQNPALVSFWAGVHLQVHQQTLADKKTLPGWERFMIEEAIQHWQQVSAGTLDTAAQTWNQPPREIKEEIKSRLGW